MVHSIEITTKRNKEVIIECWMIIFLLLLISNSESIIARLLPDSFEGRVYIYSALDNEWDEGFIELDWEKQALRLIKEFFDGNGVIITTVNLTTGLFTAAHINESGNCAKCCQEFETHMPKIRRNYLMDHRTWALTNMTVDGKKLIQWLPKDEDVVLWTSDDLERLPVLFMWSHNYIRFYDRPKPLGSRPKDYFHDVDALCSKCESVRDERVFYGESPLGIHYTTGIDKAERDRLKKMVMNSSVQRTFWDFSEKAKRKLEREREEEKMEERRREEEGKTEEWIKKERARRREEEKEKERNRIKEEEMQQKRDNEIAKQESQKRVSKELITSQNIRNTQWANYEAETRKIRLRIKTASPRKKEYLESGTKQSDGKKQRKYVRIYRDDKEEEEMRMRKEQTRQKRAERNRELEAAKEELMKAVKKREEEENGTRSASEKAENSTARKKDTVENAIEKEQGNHQKNAQVAREVSSEDKASHNEKKSKGEEKQMETFDLDEMIRMEEERRTNLLHEKQLYEEAMKKKKANENEAKGENVKEDKEHNKTNKNEKNEKNEKIESKTEQESSSTQQTVPLSMKKRKKKLSSARSASRSNGR
ncbi:uncharacterized protein MONOS_14510 [Monocercomonoides exilis]|uniref:uncharacterized protein n=1 Tax=Monocercomonoides exilis TaxID=2049356 RepID=UPI0035599A67|nr:hypothetical protein MONOS_14510 [Monocercomonoides exilis]|eukprot:MONOS_14510.1-p1 / transcript=MONOS_14510.1 / gene=MONOS_14510 / organism=Monocercomonoides_exilis_PA203 / gene_product=unspecified product / transcript_product=unspecified product / location=Mono_scaffold01015:13157-15385(-) / protein_length=594 / sequence_SO=supercontig / SO=protein_coding / is_pseudo=false